MKIIEKAKEILKKFDTEQPASLSGKFHHGETMQEHLEKCVNIMKYLCDAFGIVDENREVLIASAWLHDIGKLVLSQKQKNEGLYRNFECGYSRIDCLMKIHPIISDILLDEFNIGRKADIKRLVSVHMGHWYKNRYMPRPKQLDEYLIIMADYLASRKGDLFKYEGRQEGYSKGHSR